MNLTASLMSRDGPELVSKLPCPFSGAIENPMGSQLKPPTASNTETLGHLQGYRSKFNIQEMKQSYYQQQQQQDFQNNLEQSHQNCNQTNVQPPNRHQEIRDSSFRQPNQKFQQSGHQKKPFKQPYRNPNEGYQKAGNASGNTFWCELCERNFRTQDFLDRHVEEHEKCYFDGCKYEAHTTLVQKHIEMQHDSGLFQKIGTVETEEDIEKWRAERRKRYPTKANIELRRKAQEERMKRGEKLEKPRTRFGDQAARKMEPKSRDSSVPNPRQNNNKNLKKRQRKRNKRRSGENKSKLEDMNKTEIEEKEIGEIESFKGISRIENEEAVDLPQPEEKNTKSNALSALCMYSDSDDEEADGTELEETTNQPQDKYIIQVPEELQRSQHENSTLSANSSEEIIIVEASEENAEILPSTSISSIENHELILNNQESNMLVTMTNNESEDEGPEEQSIKYENPQSEIDHPNEMLQAEHSSQSIRPNLKRPRDSAETSNAPATKKGSGFSLLDMTKRYRKQNTLLEKLLEKDIRHERNVLLQCVRCVVEHQFFDAGNIKNEKSET